MFINFLLDVSFAILQLYLAQPKTQTNSLQTFNQIAQNSQNNQNSRVFPPSFELTTSNPFFHPNTPIPPTLQPSQFDLEKFHNQCKEDQKELEKYFLTRPPFDNSTGIELSYQINLLAWTIRFGEILKECCSCVQEILELYGEHGDICTGMFIFTFYIYSIPSNIN